MLYKIPRSSKSRHDNQPFRSKSWRGNKEDLIDEVKKYVRQRDERMRIGRVDIISNSLYIIIVSIIIYFAFTKIPSTKASEYIGWLTLAAALALPILKMVFNLIERRIEMKLYVEIIDNDAKLPFYAHEGDAGMDLYSVDETVILPGDRTLIHTGIKIQLPPNTEAQIRPRSGLALKNGITVLNTPGTIDEGYRGEIGIIVINHGTEEFKVTKGMKIAQMVIKPVLRVEIKQVDELTDSERGEGGFGSTGV